MLGIKHISFDATTHVIHYANGRVRREGKGLSFFYFSPNSSIVAIPLSSNDLPFIFNETTADYQTVTIQGNISYRIDRPNAVAEILDFTVNDKGRYKQNDLEKLHQRIINEAQTATSFFIQDTPLKQALRSAQSIEENITNGLLHSEAMTQLGVNILGVSVLAVSATPEMRRALETETREKLQQEADQAIFERRNFAVEQERMIKESELNTEIAIEEKQKQIADKKMETQLQQAENTRKLREIKVQTDVAIEEQKAALIQKQADNERAMADAKGYVAETTLRPYKELDWKLLTALHNNKDPKVNLSLAFRELAENADKITNLNISPDLLESLTNVRRKSG
ncbi:MAG: SPFH domain-containing protein [Bacteroidota bacterium]